MDLFVLTVVGISENDLISHLYDEINRQNTWYMWTVGILVTLITIIIGYFSILQWKISNNQIEKLKSEIKSSNEKSIEQSSSNLLATINNEKLKVTDGKVTIYNYTVIKNKIQKIYNNNLNLLIISLDISFSGGVTKDAYFDHFMVHTFNYYHLTGNFLLTSTDGEAKILLSQDKKTGIWTMKWLNYSYIDTNNQIPKFYDFEFQHIWINPDSL